LDESHNSMHTFLDKYRQRESYKLSDSRPSKSVPCQRVCSTSHSSIHSLDKARMVRDSKLACQSLIPPRKHELGGALKPKNPQTRVPSNWGTGHLKFHVIHIQFP
jgi:hypothetical protein